MEPLNITQLLKDGKLFDHFKKAYDEGLVDKSQFETGRSICSSGVYKNHICPHLSCIDCLISAHNRHKLIEMLKENQDSEGPFKVGDWVEITKSNKNWIAPMNHFVGKKVQIIEVYRNGWSIKFKEDGDFGWNYYDGHFIPCSPPMHITVHSKSGAPKENRKYSIKEIETNPRLLVYLDSEIDYIKITAHLKDNYLAYHRGKCHNFNQQLYCSESDLDNVGYFPEDSIILVYEDIDLNTEEEEKGEGIVTKSYSRASSISNIIKLIKV